MKIWVTKYALTSGVFECEGERSSYGPHMACVPSGQCFHGNDWHETREAALERAEIMRTARIENLKRQIARLEKLQLKVTTKGVP